jgi:hypothetical protein
MMPHGFAGIRHLHCRHGRIPQQCKDGHPIVDFSVKMQLRWGMDWEWTSIFYGRSTPCSRRTA